MKNYVFFIIYIILFIGLEVYLFLTHQSSAFSNNLFMVLRFIIFFIGWISLFCLLYKTVKSEKDVIFIFINMLLIVLFSLFMALSSFLSFGKNLQVKNLNNNVANAKINIKNIGFTDIYRTVKINNMQNFSGLSKENIYKIRTDFVRKSIFADENYKPNEDVFGQIVSHKPWISIDDSICNSENMPSKTDGLSEESRFLNNPILLISPMNVLSWNKKIGPVCNSRGLKFLPYKIEYNAKKHHIIVHYPIDKYLLVYKHPLSLTGLNAADLGYRYVRVTNTVNINFKNNDSPLFNDTYEIKDMIHLGGSCEVKGGCNNASPWQQELDFGIIGLTKNIVNEPLGKKSPRIDFSFWKEKPDMSAKIPPDMFYTIIFDERISG